MVATSVILSQFKEDVLSASVVSEFIMRGGGGGNLYKLRGKFNTG